MYNLLESITISMWVDGKAHLLLISPLLVFPRNVWYNYQRNN